MPRSLILAAALALAACNPVAEPEIITPLPDPCPASASAAVAPRPAQTAVTDAEDLQLGVQGIRILGADRYASVELGRAQERSWASMLLNRVEQTRRWCASRRPDPG